jgi:hypothetical protein
MQRYSVLRFYSRVDMVFENDRVFSLIKYTINDDATEDEGVAIEDHSRTCTVPVVSS